MIVNSKLMWIPLDLAEILKPEYDKLSERFSEEIEKGDYLSKILKSELIGDEDTISGLRSPGGAKPIFEYECSVTAEEPPIDIGLVLRISIGLKDNLFPEDEDE